MEANGIAVDRYLWPNFGDEATNFHVICIALMVNVKRRESVLDWGMVMTQILFETGSLLMLALLQTCSAPIQPISQNSSGVYCQCQLTVRYPSQSGLTLSHLLYLLTSPSTILSSGRNVRPWCRYRYGTIYPRRRSGMYGWRSILT